MYAVIRTGGKQYRATVGQSLKLEKLEGEVGQTVYFDEVLMLVDGETMHIGTPSLQGKQVAAVVVRQGRHKKIEILKFKRRKHYMKRQGHRQSYTEVKILEVV